MYKPSVLSRFRPSDTLKEYTEKKNHV